MLLQEVWVDQDADLLISAAQQAGLSHSVHFKSGIFGSGLITLSRYAGQRTPRQPCKAQKREATASL